MKKLFIALALLLFVFSCKGFPETNFDTFGISFTYPAVCEITNEKAVDGEGYYVADNKLGFGIIEHSLKWNNRLNAI